MRQGVVKQRVTALRIATTLLALAEGRSSARTSRRLLVASELSARF